MAISWSSFPTSVARFWAFRAWRVAPCHPLRPDGSQWSWKQNQQWCWYINRHICIYIWYVCNCIYVSQRGAICLSRHVHADGVLHSRESGRWSFSPCLVDTWLHISEECCVETISEALSLVVTDIIGFAGLDCPSSSPREQWGPFPVLGTDISSQSPSVWQSGSRVDWTEMVINWLWYS